MPKKLFHLSRRRSKSCSPTPAKIRLLLLFCLLPITLMACQTSPERIKHDEDQVPSNSTEVNLIASTDEDRSLRINDTKGYWDGGEWGNRPVVSLEQGISEAAHEEVMACGLNDASIYTAIEHHLGRGTPQTEPSKIVIEAQTASSETMWKRSVTVTSLTEDVFLIECVAGGP